MAGIRTPRHIEHNVERRVNTRSTKGPRLLRSDLLRLQPPKHGAIPLRTTAALGGLDPQYGGRC